MCAFNNFSKTRFLKEAPSSLTAFPSGSFREVCSVAFPLILTAISTSLMMFFDRLFLANYSIEAMNAAVTSGTVFTVFLFGALAVASIAEVIVGHYNGAARFHLLGKPVWQMVWFSLLTSLVFIPLGLFGGNLFLAKGLETHGEPYFRILMLFGFIFPLVPALAAFYIGQGKVKLVLMCSVIGNLANLVFDVILIFGIPGWIPALGTKGAAIATILAQTIQVLILLVDFLKPQNVRQYGTGNYQLDWKIFSQCLKIGFPSAIAHMIELIAWAVLMNMMALVSEAHLTVLTVGQTLYVALTFFTEGLQKAMTTLVANFIGSKQLHYVEASVRSAFKLCIAVTLLMFVPLILYPGFLVDSFLGASRENLRHLCTQALFFVWAYVFFDSITWAVAGVLIGAADTQFVMLMNLATIVLCVILPIYIGVFQFHGPPLLTWGCLLLYTIINAICFYQRYKKGTWYIAKII